MPLSSTSGAQKIEHSRNQVGEGIAPDWESVRIFLEVTRASSFRTAAARLDMTGHGGYAGQGFNPWRIGGIALVLAGVWVFPRTA